MKALGAGEGGGDGGGDEDEDKVVDPGPRLASLLKLPAPKSAAEGDEDAAASVSSRSTTGSTLDGTSKGKRLLKDRAAPSPPSLGAVGRAHGAAQGQDGDTTKMSLSSQLFKMQAVGDGHAVNAEGEAE